MDGTTVVTGDARLAVDAMASERSRLEGRARECERSRDYWLGLIEDDTDPIEREGFQSRVDGREIERKYWQHLADAMDAARERVWRAVLEADDYDPPWSNEE